MSKLPRARPPPCVAAPRAPLARPRRPLSSPAGDAGKCGAAALRGAEGWVRGAQRLPPPSPSSAVSLLARPSLWGGVEVGGAGGEGMPKRGAARQRGAVGGAGRPGPSRQPRERGPRRSDDDGVFPTRPEATPGVTVVSAGDVRGGRSQGPACCDVTVGHARAVRATSERSPPARTGGRGWAVPGAPSSHNVSSKLF